VEGHHSLRVLQILIAFLLGHELVHQVQVGQYEALEQELVWLEQLLA